MALTYGMQHIGFTVPDIDEAVAFFEKHFGAITLFSTGKIDVDDEFMKQRLAVPGNCRIKDIKVLRVGNGTNLEIFEYEGEDKTIPLKRNSEPGGFHLAFEVDDANKTAQDLKANGVEVMEGPTFIDSGPMEGLTWLYFKTPWGQFLEIVSMQGQLGYEANSKVKAWSPK